MGRNSKPRKAYKPTPRPPNSLPMSIRSDQESQNTMMLFPHLELVKYTAGQPTEESWHTIVARLNIGQILAFRHFVEVEVQQLMRSALDCMVAVNVRVVSSRLNVILEQEALIVGFALSFVDRMQEQTTRRELASAITRVYEIAAVKSKDRK